MRKLIERLRSAIQLARERGLLVGSPGIRKAMEDLEHFILLTDTRDMNPELVNGAVNLIKEGRAILKDGFGQGVSPSRSMSPRIRTMGIEPEVPLLSDDSKRSGLNSLNHHLGSKQGKLKGLQPDTVRVTLLNLAEQEPSSKLLTDTKKVYSSKLSKLDPGHKISQFPLWKIALGLGEKRPLSEFSFDFFKMGAACAASRKILLCMHGFPGRTDFAYLSTTGGKVVPIVKYDQLALMMKMVLPHKPSHTYNIGLVMCYGARSKNAELYHQAEIEAENLVTSFAYKLFRALCAERNIRLTARTGELSFDTSEMCSMVETDEAILAAIEQRRLRAKMKAQKEELDKLHQQEEKGSGGDEVRYDSYLKYLRRLSMALKFPESAKMPQVVPDPFLVPLVNPTPVQRATHEYWDTKLREYRATEVTKTRPAKKYGKLIYEYRDGVLTIVSKYGNVDGTSLLLYKGKLL